MNLTPNRNGAGERRDGMRYRIFLYKAKESAWGTPSAEEICAAITADSLGAWSESRAEAELLPLDGETVRRDLLAALTEDGQTLCKVTVYESPKERKPYLAVSTSYALAERVLKAAHTVALRYDLVLFDGETGRTFAPSDLYCRSYVTMRLRAQKLNERIRASGLPLHSLRRLELTNGIRRKSCAYAVTLKKSERPFEEETQAFYTLLKSALEERELLSTAFRCFTVRGNGYEVTYCLEGYGKCADRIGYLEDGEPRSDRIGRTPTEVALKQCGEFDGGAREDVFLRMRFDEWVDRYPNPAERFSASLNLGKSLRKFPFGVRIGGIGPYGSQVLFHRKADERHEIDPQTVSVLKIDDGAASFLLAVLKTIDPQINPSCFCHTLDLPAEWATEFFGRIRETRDLLLHDPQNENLRAVTDAFDLGSAFWSSKSIAAPKEDCAEDRAAFLDRHRYEIVRLYDVFLAWAEEQFASYELCDGIALRIWGP